MTKATVGASFLVLAALAGSAAAQDISTVNGYYTQLRVFNDFNTTALSYGHPGGPLLPEPTPGIPSNNALAGFGAGLQFHETFPAGVVGNFANKHQGLFSNDGGVSAFSMSNQQSFTVDTNVQITAPASNGQPRKEGGLVFYNNHGGGNLDEGRVLVASDNGEVAVFGGAMNFTGFGPGIYTLGTTAHIHFEYWAPGTQSATAEYRLLFTDANTGPHDSGLVTFDTNSANGFLSGSMMGFVDQNQRNPGVVDDINVIYSNPSVVPAPGAAALLGLAGLFAGRRRR
jgi:MYXO-CTERM domain-containing protein